MIVYVPGLLAQTEVRRGSIHRSIVTRIILLMMVMAAMAASLGAGPTSLTLGNISFDLSIQADKRMNEYSYPDLVFTPSRQDWPDSTVIVFSSPELDLKVKVSPVNSYLSQAWFFDVRADFKQETWLHELILSMDNPQAPVSAELKGVRAIQSRDPSLNRTIGPFMDKVVEFSSGDKRFWIVASGYAGCEGVEGLSANQIVLYDYRAHFFRQFDQVTRLNSLLRNAMYKQAGDSHRWGFLLFSEKPLLLDINRWPGDRKAALCISNDADDESLNRLKAVFEGSNNPANPRYYTKGFFARNIPISTTIFGVNQPTLGDMWNLIHANGNRIGWHTYTMQEDPPGSNEQAILHDLAHLNIRCWIDHSVPFNPEDIAYNGLYPDSLQFVGDVINQSNIDYIWPGDTPHTNPFNAYDEAWRLPHRVYEATSLTKPVWFFGRTRCEVWEYHGIYNPLSMKYMMTPDNLDALIAARGLHIAYTHLCQWQSDTVYSFWRVSPTGDYEIRDEVDDMLQMLDYYRNHRGLWIAPLEDIFDRMLDIEEVKITAVETTPLENTFKVTMASNAARDLHELSLSYQDDGYSVDIFTAGSEEILFISDHSGHGDVPESLFKVNYHGGQLVVTKSYDLTVEPMLVEVYNIRGQKVLSKDFSFNQTEHVIPFADKASGVYLARLKPLKGTSVLLKFSVVK